MRTCIYVYMYRYRQLCTPLSVESLIIPNRLKENVFSREKNIDTIYLWPEN